MADEKKNLWLTDALIRHVMQKADHVSVNEYDREAAQNAYDREYDARGDGPVDAARRDDRDPVRRHLRRQDDRSASQFAQEQADKEYDRRGDGPTDRGRRLQKKWWK